MNKKSLMVALVSLTLLAGATGCTGKQPAPQPPQGQAGQMMPPPAQPSKPVDANQVADKVTKLLDEKYPGEWKVSGKTLSKGKYTENDNFGIADTVGSEFPGSMVSIFVGEDRISSTVKNNQTGQRVLSGYPTPATVGETMKSGKPAVGSSTMGSSIGSYQKVYIPLKSGDKTVAVMSISLQ